MSIQKVYLYVFDTMADWEPALLIAELRSGRYFKKGAPKYEVLTVGPTTDVVTTMGGVRILPDTAISKLTTQDAAMQDAAMQDAAMQDAAMQDAALLILPGGDTWLEPIHAQVFPIVREFLGRNIPVAAICGATLGLGANGLLDKYRHTSNDLGFLKACCPAYSGEALFIPKPAACDGPLITASGVAPLEFAYETLKKLDVFSPATIDAWYQLFKTHEPAHFYALMGSLPGGQ